MCDVSGTLDPDMLVQRMIGATNLTASVLKNPPCRQGPEKACPDFRYRAAHG